MRSQNKYKKLQNLRLLSFDVPVRVAKFKRTKWRRLQKKILKLNKRRTWSSRKRKKAYRYRFRDILVRKHSYKRWKRLDFSFKNALGLKLHIFQFFQTHLRNRTFRKSLFFKKGSNLQFLSQIVIKNEFRLDLLLWRLHFFSSSYEARLAINNKLIFVNDKNTSGNFDLQQGDIISFTESFNLKKNLKNLIRQKRFLHFIEVDYYSNTIVFLKSPSDLNRESCFLLNYKFSDLDKLRFL